MFACSREELVWSSGEGQRIGCNLAVTTSLIFSSTMKSNVGSVSAPSMADRSSWSVPRRVEAPHDSPLAPPQSRWSLLNPTASEHRLCWPCVAVDGWPEIHAARRRATGAGQSDGHGRGHDRPLATRTPAPARRPDWAGLPRLTEGPAAACHMCVFLRRPSGRGQCPCPWNMQKSRGGDSDPRRQQRCLQGCCFRWSIC
jgi:hypothetical protein